MNGIEQMIMENEKWLWISVMVVAGVMALAYIAKIVADIKEGRRHKKIEKQWEKEKKSQDTTLYASLRR